MAFLKLENVSVGYHKNEFVVKDLTLNVGKGEFVSLLGPSGCGKTTTLRAIAGFLRVQKGRIIINGKVYNNIPPNRRNIGFVFQNYALFPHLNVFENVA
ncbi:MAG: ABC transporter ATP-binding protein, partial [Thermotogae bacterium]